MLFSALEPSLSQEGSDKVVRSRLLNGRAFLKAGGAAAALGLGGIVKSVLGLPNGAARLGDGPGHRAGWPNFVFFLIDDLGWADLGCYGSTFYETPNIDRLATQGMRFTNA